MSRVLEIKVLVSLDGEERVEQIEDLLDEIRQTCEGYRGDYQHVDSITWDITNLYV